MRLILSCRQSGDFIGKLVGFAWALSLAAHAAPAQGTTVRGLVYDSLHSRPLAGAAIAIGSHTALSDSSGQFAIDGVLPGDYRVVAQHDVLDRLGISAIGTRLIVTDRSDLVRLVIPSFAGLWRLECGPEPPAADTGFVFGTVRASISSRGILVSASWIDLVAHGTTVSQRLRTLEVPADSAGNYALCGVPTNTGFSLRASAADSLESGTFDIAALDRERIVRRDLRLIERRAAAAGSISGRVSADSGGPIANAEVTLVNAGLTTRSGEGGDYVFGDLAPGSYRLGVRKIGYAEIELGVDVEWGERRRQDVVMSRITLLDSLVSVGRVLAREEQMRVFEEHRKIGLGKFLTASELEKARSLKLSTLIRQWPGLYIPQGRTAQERDPVSRRGIKSLSGTCKIALYLDGFRLAIPLDDVPPETLAGVEYYPGAASIPIEYARPGNECGVILLHSRYRTGK
jgi:hypothetical protein